MAIQEPPTLIDSSISNWNVGSHTSASFTPVADIYYEFEIGISASTTCGTISGVSFSGSGLSPVVVSDMQDASVGERRHAVYRAVATGSPTAGTITVSTSGGSGQVISLKIFKRTGVDTTTPVRNVNTATGSDSTAEVSMGAFLNADSHTRIVALAAQGSTWSASAPMVEQDAEQDQFFNQGASACTIASAYAAENVASPVGTWGGALNWQAIGFELVAAGGGGGPALNDHNFRRVGRGVGSGVMRAAA